MPFLRLTRDRRGAEHTFLMHAAQPGERPRILYWYRTVPGVLIGRSPLDEEAIRTLEDQHPSIDFDWPAILALSEVMTPEDESAPVRPQRTGRQGRGRDRSEEPQRRDRGPRPEAPSQLETRVESDEESEPPVQDAEPIHTHGLLEELVGREIATRLHARHAEICARIDERHPEGEARDRWLRRAESLDPNTWLTPEAILEGVRTADAVFDSVRRELMATD